MGGDLMTLQEVIQAGQIDVNINPFEIIPFWAWLLLFFFIGLGLYASKHWMAGTEFFCVLGIIITVSGIFANYQFTKSEIEKDLLEKWRQQYAIPYINSLPKEKKEVVFIKIDPELSHNVKGNYFYTYSVPVKLTPLTISFKGNGIETYTNWYEAYMELTKEQKPYVEFVRLNQSLGNGYDAGLYNVKVFLPETYQFTDIK
jgi:hypothetical protein